MQKNPSSASSCDAVVPVPVLALPHDHHLAEDPRQRVLRLHLLEVHPYRLGPGEGRRAGGAAPGDRQGGDDSIRRENWWAAGTILVMSLLQ